jgi:hypothetical protein
MGACGLNTSVQTAVVLWLGGVNADFQVRFDAVDDFGVWMRPELAEGRELREPVLMATAACRRVPFSRQRLRGFSRADDTS